MAQDPLSDSRLAVWNSMLDAEMNVKYWAELAGRLSSRDTTTRIFLAAASSATVASWAIAIDARMIWQALSGLSAAMAAVLPALNLPKQSQKMAGYSGEWLQLKFDYEKLWRLSREASANQTEDELSSLRSREVKMQENTAQLPLDQELVEKCYDAVVASRNL